MAAPDSTSLDVRALREALGLTQPEMAARGCVNVSTVWRWERNGAPKRGAARAFLEGLQREVDARDERREITTD